MCTTAPLPKGLQFSMQTTGDRHLTVRNIGVFARKRGATTLVSSALQLIAGQDTGSRSFVYKMRIKQGATFSVVAKIQTGLSRARRNGLRYEKQMYRLMTELVDIGVCPFRLRSYDMNEPENVLITETYDDMQELRSFLSTLTPERDRNYRMHGVMLLVQILYALEVNYRLGLRHNDLHLSNVMVKRCPKTTIEIRYVTRNRRQKSTICMVDCPFKVLIFDNDRVTKLRAKPGVVAKNSLLSAYNPTPVLALFPWHQPSLNTEKLNMFKVMQHIRNEARTSHLRNLTTRLKIAIGTRNKENTARKHGESDFMKYHLVTIGAGQRKEPSQLPPWLSAFSSSEDALLNLARFFPSASTRKKGIVADMSRLYSNA